MDTLGALILIICTIFLITTALSIGIVQRFRAFLREDTRHGQTQKQRQQEPQQHSKARITMNVTNDGVLEIWLNEAGRDLFVSELQALTESNDHFHTMPSDVPSDLELSTKAYRPTDTILAVGKVYFRPDEWDRRYFSHVMTA
jgi:hypothetical protein